MGGEGFERRDGVGRGEKRMRRGGKGGKGGKEGEECNLECSFSGGDKI